MMIVQLSKETNSANSRTDPQERTLQMSELRNVLVGFSIGMFMLMNVSCRRAASPLPDISERPGTSGLDARTFDDERLITLAQGNLARTPATTADERARALSSFLVEHRAYFDIANVPAENLVFTMAGPEFKVTQPQGRSFMMVALHQLYQGAPVIDETQYGAFLLDSSGRVAELRRVRARLIDPSQLPAPPTPNPEQQKAADTLFRKFLLDRLVSGEDIRVEDNPVVSAKLGIAGYLAQYSKRNEDGTVSRLEAVVAPSTAEIKVLYDIPACQAGGSPAGGAR
jgi:hypothetical protein